LCNVSILAGYRFQALLGQSWINCFSHGRVE
jgi:hypothetical protein